MVSVAHAPRVASGSIPRTLFPTPFHGRIRASYRCWDHNTLDFINVLSTPSNIPSAKRPVFAWVGPGRDTSQRGAGGRLPLGTCVVPRAAGTSHGWNETASHADHGGRGKLFLHHGKLVFQHTTEYSRLPPALQPTVDARGRSAAITRYQVLAQSVFFLKRYRLRLGSCKV